MSNTYHPDRDPIVVANRERDLYFQEIDQDGNPQANAYFFPQGWCDDFSFANGNTGGIDFDPENDDHTGMADGPEIYGYVPTHVYENSPVETLFVGLEHLRKLREITEAEARQLHPNLFRYLDAINEGGVHPDDRENFWNE